MYGISGTFAAVKTLSRKMVGGRLISVLRKEYLGWYCISLRISQLEISGGSPFKGSGEAISRRVGRIPRNLKWELIIRRQSIGMT